MKRVLISTLGESPPVVTEALDILKREGKNIDRVVLITTIDSHTQQSADLLREHIFKQQIAKDVQLVSIQAYSDIDSPEALFEFMVKACGVLRDNIKGGNEVYVSIAGGRKTMSALMTLAVQIYGAKELFHIYIDDPEFEEKSRITKIRHLSEKEQNEILHPDLNKIKIVKINMPFIGLFPWTSDLIKTLKGEPTDKKEIKELLASNKLIENNKRTPLGELFLRILGNVESRPEPCQTEPRILLADHHYKREREELANKLKNRFSYICEIRDISWREGEPKVIKDPPDKLKIYIKQKGFNLGFLIRTTAKTEGQLLVVENEIKEFLESV
jgi:CRISPR-associated Csx14 family protein